MDNDIERLLHEYRDKVEEYAKARARRTYIEEFKKSKFAILMRQADRDGFKTAAAQEREAYAADEYIEFLSGLREAVEAEERLRYDLRALEMRAEVWRTLRADERFEKKSYGA
ncbi:MAG: hypothetical protein JSV87_04325 [Candidatus Bathyarchaeota archaeon]|nr:MAG: hypothetical protein JSV87_04325 [Candidatus Bathyarchaeota archaeon]